MDRVRTRYAPSPTGYLHIGGARTALFSFLYAKKHGGDFILRIEDTDTERNVEGAGEEQMDGLRWLGIEWDESVDIGGPYAPYRCMERLDIYQTYLNQLLAEGKAYYSYATKEEIEKEREEQLARGEAPKYSGWDRDLTAEERAKYEKEGRVPTVRLKVPSGKQLVFQDLVRGEVSFESDGIGDFVIAREDGRPTYNFAVVVDDYLMKISHIFRGEEHISNTPKQLLVYQAFGWKTPIFGHIPLILNPEGKKMSKRDGSIVQFISQYRELGFLPEAIVNFLSLLGWSPEGEEEIFSLEELCNLFGIERVSKSPAIFDTAKLKWMNNHYIKRADTERILDLALPYLEKAGRVTGDLQEGDRAWLKRLIGLYQEQLDQISDIVQLTDLFFREEMTYSEEAKQVLSEDHIPVVLAALLEKLQGKEEIQVAELQPLFKQIQKETGYKGKQLFMPIRAAVTGEVHGPDLKESISLLGVQKVLQRLQTLVDKREEVVGK
ncbi:glutamate--tRNA ligase [Risungbinella massiliensis]|uniref:glutamate--tRNA ligase n=1 Tax=Risungbinella massiliensis TaxID=1329796 RepID=UPI0005CC38FA|nr:glutamate--tRNA ligase [Risungbinella massiliensis]